jgi:protocatechuate 3,4-dioxygenase beta subunit
MKRRIALILALIAASLGLFVLWIHGTLESPEAEISAALGARADRQATGEVGNAAPPVLAVPANDGATAPEERREAAAVAVGPVRPAPEKNDALLTVRCIAHGTGEPLENTRVRLVAKGQSVSIRRDVPGARGSLRESPLTPANGEVEFALPAGQECRLYADPKRPDAGHVMKIVPALEPGERRTIVVEIRSGDDLNIRGVVLARVGREPIAGAKVRAQSRSSSYSNAGDHANGPTLETLAETITGGDGRFELSTASWRSPFLRVEAEGFGPTFASLPADQADPNEERIITLERGATIEATVIDARGAPLSGLAVRVHADGYNLTEKSGVMEFGGGFTGKVKWEAVTAAGGHCTLIDVPARVALSLEIANKGQVVHKASVPALEAGEVRAIELRIGGGCSVSGVVLDQSGGPVAGQVLWLTHARADQARYFQRFEERELAAKKTTDRDGRFTFDDVAGGRWLIGPAPEGERAGEPDPDAAAPLGQVVDVPPDTPERSVVIQVQRGLYIRGKVLDPAGAPAEAGYVGAYSDSARSGGSAQVGSGGAFVLGPLAQGSFKLSAGGRDTDALSEPVTANAGDDHVILELRAGGMIVGKVVDPILGRGARAELHCQAAIKGMRTPSLAIVEGDGTFQLRSLDPGTYDLAARVADGRVAILRGVAVTAGSRTTGVVLSLEPGAKLAVRYEGAADQAYFSVFLDGLRIGSDMVRAKASSLQVVPAGKLTLELRPKGSGKKQVREITIDAGEEKEVVFADGG